MVKGDGGAIGITENEQALRRWMVAGPELACMLQEVAQRDKLGQNDSHHHEQLPSIQKAFQADVKRLVDVIQDAGNPFQETSTELLTLDTKVVLSNDVVHAVRTAEDLGKCQYQQFVEERLGDDGKSFYDSIARNNLTLFKSGSKKVRPKSKMKLANVISDVNLFSRMYISCQVRDGDLDAFFEHENHAWPPSLADNNMMHQGTKSELTSCLEALVERPQQTPEVDVRILDGAALVHVLDPKKANVQVKTFKDYACQVVVPHVLRQLHSVKRLDVVWDCYHPDSLEAHSRQCRGEGDTLRVADSTRLPANWSSFLRSDSNKKGLFGFLSVAINSTPVSEDKILVTTYEDKVLSPCQVHLSQLQPCTHEEADYRMMLHMVHAYQQGHRKIMIHATDTDVLILAITASSDLPGCEVWLALGHGTKFRYIAVHDIAS